jgi:hypothetical protein
MIRLSSLSSTSKTVRGAPLGILVTMYLESRETGDWGLGTGDWGLGTGDWVFRIDP